MFFEYYSIPETILVYTSWILVLHDLLTAKPKHRLGRALFLLQNGFLALVLPNLNRSGYNFAHTYCYTEYTCGPTYTAIGAWPNENDYVFLIFVTHPKSYIETTDRRDFGGKPSEWRWRRVLSWKIPEIYSVAGARSKNSILAFLEYPSTDLRTA